MNTCLIYTCNSEMITSVHNVMHSILHLSDTIIIISATMHGMAGLCSNVFSDANYNNIIVYVERM